MNATRWPALGLVAAQAWLLWSSSELVAIPLLGLLLAVVSLIPACRLRLPLAVWGVVGVVAAAGVLTKCGLWHYPEAVSTWVLPAAWTLALAECLVLIQGLLMLARYPAGDLPAWFPTLGVLAFAGIYNRTIDYDQHPEYLLVAMVMATSWMVFGIASGRSGSGPADGARPAGPQDTARLARRLVLGSMGLVVLLCGWQLSEQMSRNVAFLRPWSLDFGLRNRRAATGAGYVRDATLHSVTRAKGDQPMGIALRVVATRRPGYLRGRVFDTYESPRWRSVRAQAAGSSGRDRLNRYPAVPRDRRSDLPPTSRDVQTFVLESAASGPWSVFEVWNDPDRGPVFFLPLGTAAVQGQGGYVTVDQHGVVRGGLSTRKSYKALLERGRRSTPLAAKDRERLLEPLAGLDPRIGRMAAEVCRGCTSPVQKMDAVREFFHQNFRYGLGQMVAPEGVEPLSYFLLNRPPAHCEFFASGAIALLRSQGVPCRYVTGYVVEEQDDYGDYWLARNRNAHAWVEAYDDRQQRWVVVEPTPGMFVPNQENESADEQEVAIDQASGSGLRLGAGMFQGDWSLGPWQTPLALSALVVLAGCLVYLRPEWRSRALAVLGFSPDPWRAYHRQLARLDRRLRFRRLKRQSHETLHQFAERVRGRADRDPWLAAAADWYLAYAAARYAPDGAEPAEKRLPPLP